MVRRRHSVAAAGLCTLLAIGCFKQQPPDERTQSAPPAEPRPEPPPSPSVPPAAVRASRPEAESIEQKREAPADGTGAAERSGNAAARPASSAPLAPQKPAAKARSSARPKGASDEDRAIGGALGQQSEPEGPVQLRQRLDRAYRASTPDCPSARERKKAVCDLASQICQLIDRDPNVASVAEYCAEAKERCTEAERRTAERCGE